MRARSESAPPEQPPDLAAEQRLQKVVLRQLLQAERNELLELLQELQALLESECRGGAEWRVDHRLAHCFLEGYEVYYVIKAMLQHLDDEAITAQALAVLAVLAENRARCAFVDLNAVTAICLRVLQQHLHTLSCLLPALEVLCCLTSPDALKRLENEGILVLQKVLCENVECGDVCEYIACIVRSACTNNPVLRMQSSQAGIVQNLLHAALLHSNRAAFLYDALEVCVTLLGDPAAIVTSTHLTAIDVALHCMGIALFATNASFALLVLRMLKVVAATSAKSAQHFVRKQGLGFLASCLHAQLGDREIGCACCDVLSAVCSVRDIGRDVLAAGLLPRVLALLAPPPPPAQLFSVVHALRVFACLSIDCVQALVAAAAVRRVLATRAQWAAEEALATECVWLLYRLASVEEGCAEMVACNVESVLQPLEAFAARGHDLEAKRLLLLQNLQLYRRRSARSPARSARKEEPAAPTTFSFESPLIHITMALLHPEQHDAAKMLVALKSLETLCAASVPVEEMLQLDVEAMLFSLLLHFPTHTDLLLLTFHLLELLTAAAGDRLTLTDAKLLQVLHCLQEPAVLRSVPLVLAILRFLAAWPLAHATREQLRRSALLPALLHACSACCGGPPAEPPTESLFLAYRRSSWVASVHLTASQAELLEALQETDSPHTLEFLPPEEQLDAYDAPSPAVVELVDTLVDFLLRFVPDAQLPALPELRAFFLQNKLLLGSSLLRLLKCDRVCRAATGRRAAPLPPRRAARRGGDQRAQRRHSRRAAAGEVRALRGGRAARRRGRRGAALRDADAARRRRRVSRAAARQGRLDAASGRLPAPQGRGRLRGVRGAAGAAAAVSALRSSVM